MGLKILGVGRSRRPRNIVLRASRRLVATVLGTRNRLVAPVLRATGCSSAPVGGRVVWRTCLFGWHGRTVSQRSRFRSRSDRWPSLVDRGPLLWLTASNLLMLLLNSYRRNVSLTFSL